MDSVRSKSVEKTNRDIGFILRKSWHRLRLSVRYPERVPTWDAIVVTASSPKQAKLYLKHLLRAVRQRRIAATTVTMIAPDPDGHRIGSGAATLNAIEKLAGNYLLNELNLSASENAPQFMSDSIKNKHVLLIHAGGDSKRVPWANTMGKVFLPLPFLASDDPDGRVPLLFDHILAIASCARQAFENEGGIMIMTGDVLPCFDASELILPEDSSCIITAPITLDVAANHGVVVASKSSSVSESHPLFFVDNLLQKPNLSELTSKNAVLDDGRTLLDTGVIAVRGKAWANLASLACSSRRMISDLITNSNEMSLYEELVAAWVPAKHDWVRTRPMGEELLEYLGNDKMHTFCAYDLKFLHFGTSGEVLDHLSEASSGLIERRHLSIIPANDASDISPSAVILASVIDAGVSVGEDSLIFRSSLSSGTQIGSSSIVISFTDCRSDDSGNKFPFVLPPRHCFWEVCIGGESEKVVVYCGLYDNPKSPFLNGTFCGRPWKRLLKENDVKESDLWEGDEKCLWNARIFPVLPLKGMLECAAWLMGDWGLDCHSVWRESRRMSLEMIHKIADFEQMERKSRIHNGDIAAVICRACITGGLVGRNLSKLCEQILEGDETTGVDICRDFFDTCKMLLRNKRVIVPKSRVYQLQYDLLKAIGERAGAARLRQQIWSAVADETADAVNFLPSPTNDVALSRCMSSVKVELPVRVDFSGGWSDTPPWSLERTGCVLNMAIKLQGSLPVGAEIETTEDYSFELSDDVGNYTKLKRPSWVIDEPFRLVKSALIATAIFHKSSTGLKIKTWARVPRGSGLGTSSILAAAVVKGILLIFGGDSSNDHVARLVLDVEQRMGTGGGWQDQIGGLYGGIKFTRSFPGVPIRLDVMTLTASARFVRELKERLVVVFSGQVRDGREVVEKVVGGYLRRERAVVGSIRRLAELAREGRAAVAEGRVEQLGAVMIDTWRIHLELDPSSTNGVVEELFGLAAPLCCGYKLVGAGGGGFALLLAYDSHSASQLRTLLRSSDTYRIYDWDLHY